MPVGTPLSARAMIGDRVSSHPGPRLEPDYPVGSAPATVA
ncbi:hypothetical protein NJ7G_3237 [Natrinema sp. J7-2]|nr:hypothetical protein NJ7G_3237 [Natrinema sp. J7-2]